MKRFLAILIFFAANVATAQQPPPYPAPLPPTVQPAEPIFDAKLYHEGVMVARFVGADRTAPQKANALRSAFSLAKPGDLVLIGLGTFDFGPLASGHVILPDKVTVRGMGRELTTLTSSIISDTFGTSFALQNTVVEDLTLKNDCWYDSEDGRCVGFDNGAFGVPAGPFTATIRRCNLWCRDWCCYCWSPGNVWTLDDCDITTGRVGIAAENSGNGQDITLHRCRIFGDASLSKSRGETSNQTNGGVFGCIARGGPLRLYDCEINIKGKKSEYPSYTPRACGIVDRGGGGDAAGRAVISLYNLRCTVNPNGADPTMCWDLNLEFPYVQQAVKCNWSNCWGSAADGTLSKSWPDATPAKAKAAK
jgi:hypothetical protein